MTKLQVKKLLTRRKLAQFKKLFDFWCLKLLKKKFPIHCDNRFDAHLVTLDYGYNHIELVYNTKQLALWSWSMLILGIFHEIGHIKYRLPYDSNNQKIKDEYLAEKYALRMLKKYYPQYLKSAIRYSKNVLNDKEWQERFPLHYQAFIKIKDYQ